MSADANAVGRLRDYVVAQMHSGHIREGERLPSYRELSARWGVDHRVLARAFRELEDEGLVEVRARRGVYLRRQERIGGEMLPETARWLAEEVLEEAWRRRIRVPELPEFIRRCTAAVRLRCACLESTEDHLAILSRELSEWFGFDASPIRVEQLRVRRTGPGVYQIRESALPRTVRRADLLVTTGFHAPVARSLAQALRRPLVVARVHPATAEAIDRHLAAHERLSVVAIDPAFAERVRAVSSARPDRIHFASIDDARELAALDPREPVLASFAVIERLPRTLRTLISPRLPAIAPESALELARVLIRLNLEASRTASARPRGTGASHPPAREAATE